MQPSSFLKVPQRLRRNWSELAKLWKEMTISSVSLEYQQWRHRFIFRRLYLTTWIIVILMLIGYIVSWIIPLTPLEYKSPEYNYYRQNIEVIYAIRIINWAEVLFTFVLLKTSYARKYPVLILLWLTWTLLVSYQVLLIIFYGSIYVDGYNWILVFSSGPVLMPVKWRSHCICQIFFLGLLAISSLVLGFGDPFVTDIEYFNAVYSTVIVCTIVNLAVFLYEKFLQQEFELRRQLRLFLHTVSHDLRSPMLGTIFLLKSLRNSAATTTVIENEILDRIIDSSDRQLQLINSLLEAHQTETKGIVIRSRPVCLNTLVESIVTEMKPFLDSKNASITKKIPKKLPFVNIDPLQVRRVYDNLIANAIEYNRSGLHLTLTVEDEYFFYGKQPAEANRLIYCTVSDNGIGIPPQQQSHIFDLYTRAGNNKQSLNVGLGLYICRQIINAHGGEIGVNSNSQGASFWFTLPIAKTDD